MGREVGWAPTGGGAGKAADGSALGSPEGSDDGMLVGIMVGIDVGGSLPIMVRCFRRGVSSVAMFTIGPAAVPRSSGKPAPMVGCSCFRCDPSSPVLSLSSSSTYALYGVVSREQAWATASAIEAEGAVVAQWAHEHSLLHRDKVYEPSSACDEFDVVTCDRTKDGQIIHTIEDTC